MMNPSLKKITQLTLSLALAGLFGLSLFLTGLPREAAVVYAAGETCFATIDGSTVYSSTDASAVQDAINAASAGDVIKIAGTCAGVTQTAGISQTAYISQNLTLQGGYVNGSWLDTPDPDTYSTVVDAESNGRVVYIKNGAEVTLEGLTIQHGLHSGFGGGIANQGVLTVTNSRVLSNTATNFGGGIDNGSNNLTISNSLIKGNSANRGGGITNYVGDMTIISTTIEYNQANTGNGGGISNDAGSFNLIDTLILCKIGKYVQNSGVSIENHRKI